VACAAGREGAAPRLRGAGARPAISGDRCSFVGSAICSGKSITYAPYRSCRSKPPKPSMLCCQFSHGLIDALARSADTLENARRLSVCDPEFARNIAPLPFLSERCKLVVHLYHLWVLSRSRRSNGPGCRSSLSLAGG